MGGRDHSCECCGHGGFNDPEPCNCLGEDEVRLLFDVLDHAPPTSNEELAHRTMDKLASQIRDWKDGWF